MAGTSGRHSNLTASIVASLFSTYWSLNLGSKSEALSWVGRNAWYTLFAKACNLKGNY